MQAAQIKPFGYTKGLALDFHSLTMQKLKPFTDHLPW
jgi:hypothetical protein